MCKDCIKLNKLIEIIGLREKYPHIQIYCCSECKFKDLQQNWVITPKKE